MTNRRKREQLNACALVLGVVGCDMQNGDHEEEDEAPEMAEDIHMKKGVRKDTEPDRR